MRINKLVPNDPRVTSATTIIRGKTYHYMRALPRKEPIATIFLIHGFPDLSFGWRYQVPHFVSLGYQVVIPDMLGFGATATPDEPSLYALKNIAKDIKELAANVVGNQKIILGGHDWGGIAVWRTALWYPNLVLGIFSVCTPFIPPSRVFLSLDDAICSGTRPELRPRLQIRSMEVENKIQDAEQVRQFLNAMFGGVGPHDEVGFSTEDGILSENLPKLNRSRLVSDIELDHYTQQYLDDGSPQLKALNWYRARSYNYLDELHLLRGPIKFPMPALFLTATRDEVPVPEVSGGMDQYFEDLTHGEIKASHWALWESPAEVNRQVAAWMTKVLKRVSGNA
ncbi:Alpha/Beta hydrolase protein [Ilyonectria destructans]|nr:Alpha/Beta hydrolase protein [Ilyonectria destructans]